MDLCDEPSCLTKTIMLDIIRKHSTFNQMFSYLPCSIWTIDFYHFIWTSLTLTLPEGLVWMKCNVVNKQFKLSILRLILNKIYWNEGNNCCFTVSKVKKTLALAGIQAFINQFVIDMIDTIVLYVLILVLLTLIWGHRSMRKQKLMYQLSQS